MSRRTYDVTFYLPTLGPLIDPEAAVPFAGGAETQIWLLARGLARRGYAICVVVVDIPHGLPARMDGVDVVTRPQWEGGRGFRGRVAELRTLWGTLGALRSRIVVQRAAGFSTGLVGTVTRAKRRTFVYSSAHILDFDFEQLASTRRELRLFHLGVRLANLIIAQTREQALQCRAKFGRDAVVIRSIAEPAQEITRRADNFLWVGRLVEYKAPEAFLALADALPEARFQMVGAASGGDPALVGRIKRQAVDIPNLELLDAMPRSTLLELYLRAAAVVNTSKGEGMPNTFLEGWARGIPALALAHDPDGLIVSEQLGEFAAGSPERLACLAREMWKSRNDRPGLTRRCLEYVRREHDSERVIDRWIEALGLSPEPSPAAVRSVVAASNHARVS